MPINLDPFVTVHGRRLALSPDGHLILDGRMALANPNKPVERVVWFDDFLGDAIVTPYTLTEGTDSATSDFAINSQIGGVARITTGDSATVTMAGNGIQVDFGMLNFKASNGGLTFETRFKLDIITAVAFFIGFTDQVAALEMPWGLSVVTYTSTQTDGCGFLFDTAATTDTIRCVGVKADVDATLTDTAIAPVAATFMKLRIEVDASGTATFFINNAQVARMENALTVSVALTPVIAAYSSEAVSKLLDLDYVLISADRT